MSVVTMSENNDVLKLRRSKITMLENKLVKLKANATNVDDRGRSWWSLRYQRHKKYLLTLSRQAHALSASFDGAFLNSNVVFEQISFE